MLLLKDKNSRYISEAINLREWTKQEPYYSSGDIWDQSSYPSQQSDGTDGQRTGR